MAEAAETLVPYRWTRAEYEEIARTGVFAEKRVELLHGAIYAMSPPSAEHASLVDALLELLAPALGRARLRIQNPVAATDDSMPEPDVFLGAGPRPAHPKTGRLAVEVVVSQRNEARIKTEIYAAAGIVEYWIVDEPRRAVEVLTVPGETGYEHVDTLRGSDRLAIPEFGIVFTVDELFTRAGLGRS